MQALGDAQWDALSPVGSLGKPGSLMGLWLMQFRGEYPILDLGLKRNSDWILSGRTLLPEGCSYLP